MKKSTRILAAIIVCLMIVTMFASCDNGGGTSTPAESSGESNVSSPVDDGFALPEKNWENTTIVVGAVGTVDGIDFSSVEFAPSETNNEPVNDATFERNAFIEEKYGITISVAHHKDYVALIEDVETNIDGGDDYMQLVATAVHRVATGLGEKGYLYDLNTANEEANCDYLQLSNAWWDQSAIRDLSIANTLYYATGDICVTDDTATWGIFYNKDIVESNAIEDLVTVVREKRWTLDYMYTAAKTATKLVGDKMDYTEDTEDVWGMVSQTYDGVSFMWGFGQSMVAKNGDDIPEIRILDERNVSIFDKFLTFIVDQTYVGVADFYGAWNSGIYGVKTSIFTNGHALFLPGSLSTVDSDQMRNANIRYGILPMPLADELQEQYASHGNVYGCTVVGIPISVSDKLDATLFTMEAMAYYGKQMVTDKYYETTLKNKRFPDDDSPEMLDLICSNRTYDLAAIYNWNEALYIYTGQIGGKTNTLISTVEGQMTALETAMKATIEAIQANKAG